MGQDDHYVVVSADSHAGAELDVYRQYLDARWVDEFDRWREHYVSPWADLRQGADFAERRTDSAAERFNADGAARLEAIDGEGVAAEVLYPNTTPPFFPESALFGWIPNREEYDRRRAGVLAHNRWMADFCAQAPDRRVGLAQVFTNSIEDAVADVAWAHDHGLRGMLIGSVPPGAPSVRQLWDPAYDPFWRACAERGMPVGIHEGSGAPEDGYGSDPVARAVMLTEYRFYSSRSLTALLFGGVFDRHPDLSVVLAEMGASWVPDHLAMLDAYWSVRHTPGLPASAFIGEAMRALPMSPSQYFARNCYLGTFLSRTDVALRERIGVDRMMWAADFPHEEGSYPYSREAQRFVLSDVPETECRAILGKTAAAVYGLDLGRLQTIADRIGPTVADVATRLESSPDPHGHAYAFRTNSSVAGVDAEFAEAST
jgi:predicted TIM-barrel fold metal-dependent hydrolase